MFHENKFFFDWLITNHRESIDANFCINPDGGGGDLKNGKPVTMAIQTSEKLYISYRFEVKNKGGHGSLPVMDNAIYSLASGLNRLANYNFQSGIFLKPTFASSPEKIIISQKIIQFYLIQWWLSIS